MGTESNSGVCCVLAVFLLKPLSITCVQDQLHVCTCTSENIQL